MREKQEKPGTLLIWWVAMRPKTLPAAIVPVLMGTVMAYGDGGFQGWAAGMALICALLLQIEANFVNDYMDFKKGTDDARRIGPLRVTQAGWVTPLQMKRAIYLVFGLTLLFSLYLVYRAGWPVVVIGGLAILSSAMYTAGPFPLGYYGFGDIFVFLFFGPVALAGTYYVQVLAFNPLTLLAGVGPGLLSVAILTVNNLRDMEGDQRAGKRTLAVRFGRTFTMYQYYYCLVVAACVGVVLFLWDGKRPGVLMVMAILFFAPSQLRSVFSSSDGPTLNQTLAKTGRLLVVYGLLFSLGWLIFPA